MSRLPRSDGRRRRAFLTLLRDLSREQSLPMMVVTHQVEEVAELADHVIAVSEGQVIAHGTAADVMRRADFTALLDRRDLGARVDASVGARRAGRRRLDQGGQRAPRIRGAARDFRAQCVERQDRLASIASRMARSLFPRHRSGLYFITYNARSARRPQARGRRERPGRW